MLTSNNFWICKIKKAEKNQILTFPFQELEHSKDMVSRAILDSKAPEEIKNNQAIVTDTQLPLEQKKRKIQRNLRTLEQNGIVSSKNKYQDLLNEIAKVSGNSIFFLLNLVTC